MVCEKVVLAFDELRDATGAKYPLLAYLFKAL